MQVYVQVGRPLRGRRMIEDYFWSRVGNKGQLHWKKKRKDTVLWRPSQLGKLWLSAHLRTAFWTLHSCNNWRHSGWATLTVIRKPGSVLCSMGLLPKRNPSRKNQFDLKNSCFLIRLCSFVQCLCRESIWPIMHRRPHL
jgi:hypothetical protein